MQDGLLMTCLTLLTKNLLNVLGAEKKRENYAAALTDFTERWVFTGSLMQKYYKFKK